MGIPKHWKLVRGNSYPVRNELSELGARYDRETQSWYAPPEKLAEAEEIIERGRTERSR